MGSFIATIYNSNITPNVAFILLLMGVIGFQINDIYVYLKCNGRKKEIN